MNQLSQSIVDYIAGCSKPIRSKDIENRFLISGEELRWQINTMRRQGVPIGSNHLGYFICESDEQLKSTIDNLENRISSMAQAIAGLRSAKISRGDTV